MAVEALRAYLSWTQSMALTKNIVLNRFVAKMEISGSINRQGEGGKVHE